MNTDIDLVLAFLQTRPPADDLATSLGLKAWLAARDLPCNATPTAADVSQARHLRAALSDILLRGELAWADERTRQTFEGVTSGSTLRIAAGNDGGLNLTPTDDGAQGGLAAIAVAFYRITVRGEGDRLKACAGCGWAFYDVSKNSSRRWCDMALCGSQQKSRAYRRRQSAGAHRDA